MKFLIILLISFFLDGTHSSVKSTYTPTSIIVYPGFPTDTLRTDSMQFCIITNYGKTTCDNNEKQSVIFTFDPTDSIMTEYTDDLGHVLINIYQIKDISVDSIPSSQGSNVARIKVSRYFMKSKLEEFKDNVYIIEKLYDINLMKMYAITPKETYRVTFFHF